MSFERELKSRWLILFWRNFKHIKVFMLRKIGIRKIGIHKFPKCQFSRVPLHWRGHSANRLRLHLEGRGAVTALRPTPFSVSSPTPGELGSRQQKRGCVENKVGRCQRILTALKTYYDYDSDSDGSTNVSWSEIFVWFWRLDLYWLILGFGGIDVWQTLDPCSGMHRDVKGEALQWCRACLCRCCGRCLTVQIE